MLLQHDNPRPHISAATSAVVESNGFEVVPTDSAPSDFWFFGALNKYLKGNRFICDEEIQAATAKWFREQPEEFYTDGFENLVQRWRLYRTRWILRGKVRYRNKVQNLSSFLCFVSFR